LSQTAAASSSPVFGDGLATRLGGAVAESPRTFWMVGHQRADFEAALHLIEGLMARHPRVDIVFTAPQPETRAWLRERFPRGLVLPPPLPFAPVCSRYLINLNVRGLAILGALQRADRAVLKAANARALPAVLVETADGRAPAPSATALGAVPERLECHFVAGAESQALLLGAGIPAERIALLPADAAGRSTQFVEVVSDLLVHDLKLIRSKLRPIRRRVERLALKSMDHPRLRRLLAFKAERYDSIEELRRALGEPQTILCLGNGPSSEDSEVAKVAYDSLFRVNFRWLDRGFLTEPDMVFTGSKESLKRVRGAIFGLQSIRSEARLLVTRILHPAFARMRYAAIERFGLFISESHLHGVRPTNGAAMLAVAVALRPARLVISGIDLFSHPDGSYPGDTKTPNAYTPGHDANSELALLLAALDLFEGELVILSEALRRNWEAHRHGGSGAQTTAEARNSEDSEGAAASGRSDLRLA
jgi:hypothetical protein